MTRGALLHALQPRIKAIWPIGTIVDKINGERRAQWQREEAKKKEEEEALEKSKTVA